VTASEEMTGFQMAATYLNTARDTLFKDGIQSHEVKTFQNILSTSRHQNEFRLRMIDAFPNRLTEGIISMVTSHVSYKQ